MAPDITSATYHRNGSTGAGYYTLRLQLGDVRLAAIVFDAAEHVAVLDDSGASWRCEDFEPALRQFIDSDECRSMCWPMQFAANRA